MRVPSVVVNRSDSAEQNAPRRKLSKRRGERGREGKYLHGVSPFPPSCLQFRERPTVQGTAGDSVGEAGLHCNRLTSHAIFHLDHLLWFGLFISDTHE